jgi:hypothetical protein
MPAKEVDKTIVLEHPSGSKAEVALFGKEIHSFKNKWLF